MHHPVRERPRGPGAIRATRGLDERRCRSRLEARRQTVTRQWTLGQETVEVWVGMREASIGGRDRGKRIGSTPGCVAEHRRDLLEPDGDESRFEILFPGEVLVERRRLDTQPVSETPHREGVGPFLLEQLERGSDDVVPPLRAHAW